MTDFIGYDILAKATGLQQNTLYGYVPSRTAALAFIVLFSISTATHFGQAVYTRNWWLIPTLCICGAVEVAGWGGRLWSHHNPRALSAYLLQICTTILAPTFMLAANFVIFQRIVERLGTSYSRLPPKWYPIIFITCDVISLIIQGTGGGLASVNIRTDPAPGGRIMLGGIAFQLFIIVVSAFLAIEFFVRYSLNKPFRRGASNESLTLHKPMSRNLRIMIFGLVFSTTCLFIRAVYRLIELSDGWTGRIIHTEIYFNVLDGAMVTLAIFTLNFIHPGIFLKEAYMDDSVEKAHA